MTESERWKVIPAAPEYEVSSSGDIHRIKSGHVLNPSVTKQGECIANLFIGERKRTKAFSWHRIVADAFVENPNGFPCVMHKDGNRGNNSASNLEWVSRSRCMKSAYESGSKKPTRGFRIRTPIGDFSHQREAAQAAGISQSTLAGRLKSERFPDWYNLSD